MKVLWLLTSWILVAVARPQRKEGRNIRPKSSKCKSSKSKSKKASVGDEDDSDYFSKFKEKTSIKIKETRFNKCPTPERIDESMMVENPGYVGSLHLDVFPLMPEDYLQPDSPKWEIVRRETMADSVVLPDDDQLHGYTGVDVDYWLEDPVTGAEIKPLYPGDEGFWDEFWKVVDARIARENNSSAFDYNKWPDTWEDRNSTKLSPWPASDIDYGQLSLGDVAEAVNGEYPAYHQQIFIKMLFKDGVKLDPGLGQPFRSTNDFIGKPVRMATINTWVFEAVAPVNFMLKWHFGMPRPEEVAYKIFRGDFTEEDELPPELVEVIQAMDLKDAHDFTAYKSTGSPFHPSFPAMHSAGSSCSLWLAALCDLTPEQYLEALRVDYAVATGRTVAGVHYEQDNIAGLNIGQRIIREQLPDFLEDMYGYDSRMVAKKLKLLSFDWKHFDSHQGTINGMSTKEFLKNAMEA
mmetsp:Transcript_87/g.222  ORF Transcript_87/g.222 Transcript_87/m.222 type:complete len:464 (-) Transcript_87:473-1864(-)